jgi:hypothetical protein
MTAWEHINQAAVFAAAARQELIELSHPSLWAPIAQAHQIGTLLDACDRLDDAVLLLHSIRASLPADAARDLAAPSQPTTPIVTTVQQETDR